MKNLKSEPILTIFKHCRVIPENGVSIVVFPEIPQWFITDGLGEIIIKLLQRVSRKGFVRAALVGLGVDKEIAQVLVENFVTKAMKIIRDLRPMSINRLKVIRVFTIALTERCNLNCRHCYLGSKKTVEIPFDYVCKILQEARLMGATLVSFSGGEALLRKDIYDILLTARNLGFKVFLLSNGTLITEEVAKKLKQLDVAVQVSVEGPDAKTNDKIRGRGTFEKAMNGIKKCLKNGIRVELSVTLMKNNLDKLCEMIDLAHKLGIKVVRMGLPKNVGNISLHERELYPSVDAIIQGYKTVDSFLRQKKTDLIVGELAFYQKRVAYMAKHVRNEDYDSEFNVSADGHVSPCQNLFRRDFGANSIYHNTIWEIRDTSTLYSMFKNTHVDKITSCKECVVKYICGGGCRGYALQIIGDINALDPLCEVHFAMLTHYMSNVKNYPNSLRNLTENALMNYKHDQEKRFQTLHFLDIHANEH